MPQAYTVSSHLEERLKGRRAALDALRALPEEYQLFYNPFLRGKETPAAEVFEPVVDYALAHKEKGLLGVVVKSGEIVEEPGGFISQYQPQKQLYKIIDPIKPADMALRALLMDWDLRADKACPCGVAVLFPDTQRFEFSQPKSCYLFADDIASPEFQKKLDELFLEPVEKDDQEKFRGNFLKLSEFLKVHSDNAAVFEARKEKPRLIEAAKKATPPVVPPSSLRMKGAAAQNAQARGASVQETKEEAPTPPPKAKTPPAPKIEKPAAEAQPQKSLAIAKAEKLQTPIIIPAAKTAQARGVVRAALPKESARQRDLFAWIQEAQERGEGDAVLSASQWAMVIGVSVGILCAVYFMSRNFAVAMS